MEKVLSLHFHQVFDNLEYSCLQYRRACIKAYQGQLSMAFLHIKKIEIIIAYVSYLKYCYINK